MTITEIIRRLREFADELECGATHKPMAKGWHSWSGKLRRTHPATEPVYLARRNPICDAWDRPEDCDGYLLTDGEPT